MIYLHRNYPNPAFNRLGNTYKSPWAWGNNVTFSRMELLQSNTAAYPFGSAGPVKYLKSIFA